MSKAWEYNPARRYFMQAVMWGMLGLVTILAAVVAAHRRAGITVQLSAPRTLGAVTVAPPNGWQVQTNIAGGAGGEVSPIVLTATEPRGHRGDPPPRQLVVWLDPLPLDHPDPLDFAVAEWPEREEVTHSPIRIAGSPGVLVKFLGTATAGDDDGSGGDPDDRRMFAGGVLSAATVLPSGRGLKVQLTLYSEPDSEDADLLARVVSSLKIRGEPALSAPPNGEVALPSVGVGVSSPARIGIPDGFALVDPTDPLRTSRTLRAVDSSGAASADWKSIRLIPTLVPPGESSGAAAVEHLATMMWLADSAIAESAQVREESPGRWRIERPTSFGLVPSRAFVVADPAGSGAALMATFHGGSDDAWIETAWQQIAGHITFPKVDDVLRAQQSAGEAEVQRIAAAVKPQASDATTTSPTVGLLGADRPEEWWTLELTDPDRPIGWIHSQPSSTGGKSILRVHVPGVEVVQSDFTFHGGASGSASLASAMAQLVISASADVTPSSMVRSLSRRFPRDMPLLGALGGVPNFAPGDLQKTMEITARLKNGKLDLATSPAQGEATAVTIAAPPNYLPGGWLDALLMAGKLTRERPMLLRSDVLPGDAGVHPTSLITVLLRPGESDPDASTSSSGLLIEIPGSGELLRCTFRRDGWVDTIEHPSGLRQVRSDGGEIALQFARDPRMKP